MKFINLEPIGHEINIEVVSNNQVWDLHNCADFIDYRFNEEEGILILLWDYGCDCEDIVWGKVSLIFSGVFDLHITPVDPEVPRDEDLCLETLSILNDHVTIEFRGGRKV